MLGLGSWMLENEKGATDLWVLDTAAARSGMFWRVRVREWEVLARCGWEVWGWRWVVCVGLRGRDGLVGLVCCGWRVEGGRVGESGSWYILKRGGKGEGGGPLVWRRGRDGLLAIDCWAWGGGWWVEG